METKVCNKCNKDKCLNEFHKNCMNKSGRLTICKECRNYPRVKRSKETFEIIISMIQYMIRFGLIFRINNRDGILIINNHIKRCYRCKKVKDLDDFHNDKNRIDNKSYECKECLYETSKKHRQLNRERYNKYSSLWKLRNSEKCKENQKLLYYKNPCLASAKCYFRKGITGISINKIPPRLIKYKEIHTLLKRALKSSQST